MPLPANVLSEVELGALCAEPVPQAIAPLPAAVATRPSARAEMFDPVRDKGWDTLLATHPGASFFHSSAWAHVLHDTYGHQPAYFCRLENGQLQALFPVMEVRSALTHRRGVALPFTDFSMPLAASRGQYHELFAGALDHGRERKWTRLECRGGPAPASQAPPSLTFYGHLLDLSVGEAALFKNLDPAVRRGIRKAQAAGLAVQFSASDEAMRTFFSLHCITRRRHGLPPQPYRFFSNITKHIMARGHGFIASISIESKTVASAIFFHNQRHAIYKFGASDFAFQQSRPNNLLMWEAIKHCADLRMNSLQFGRTSFGNEGLRRFKLGFGAREEQIDYFKFDFAKNAFVGGTDRVQGWYNTVFSYLPGPLLRLAGRILYPHLA